MYMAMYLLCITIYYVPGNVLSDFYVASHLILTIIL